MHRNMGNVLLVKLRAEIYYCYPKSTIKGGFFLLFMNVLNNGGSSKLEEVGHEMGIFIGYANCLLVIKKKSPSLNLVIK